MNSKNPLTPFFRPGADTPALAAEPTLPKSRRGRAIIRRQRTQEQVGLGVDPGQHRIDLFGGCIAAAYQAGDGLNVRERRDHACSIAGATLTMALTMASAAARPAVTSAAVTMRYAPDKRICWTTIKRTPAPPESRLGIGLVL